MQWSARQCRVFAEFIRQEAVRLHSSFRDAIVQAIALDPVKSILKGGPLSSFSDGAVSSTRGLNAGKTQADVVELSGYLLEVYDTARANLVAESDEDDFEPNESDIVDEFIRLLVPVREISNDFTTLGFQR